MKQNITPARFIREHIFRIEKQAIFGELLGYSQASISRFESGEVPLTTRAQQRIRALAKVRSIDWDNNWFFEVPTETAA